MTKILVLYYSSWGHMEQMANAAATGARSAGAEATVKRVAELAPDSVVESAHYKTDQPAPLATVDELPDYDGFIFGTPTRFGNMCAQMKNFLDQTGAHWQSGALIDKPATVMVSTASQHGGAEATLLSTQIVLQHQGMLIVPLSYAYQDQLGNDTVRGGSPYGMTTTSGGDGARQPSNQELEGATFQGQRLAGIAIKLQG